MWCDFHLHSDRSDGEFSPARVVDVVADAGIGAFALTDHDTTTGHASARERAARRHITFVGGIEMTAYAAGQVIHVLGLGIEDGHAAIERANGIASSVWADNQQRWVESLQRDGFDVRPERDLHDGPLLLPALVLRLCARGVDGGDPRKVHARFREFFAALGADAYSRLPSPAQAAVAIHAAGGVAILAHPGRLNGDGVALSLIDDMDGIEALYGPYEPAQRDELVALAVAREKLYSCGSDYHGYFNGEYRNPGFEAPPALAARLGL
jgi:hypothetical protein